MTKSKGQVQQRLRSLPDSEHPGDGAGAVEPPKGDPDLDYKIEMIIPGAGRIIGHSQFDESNRMTQLSSLRRSSTLRSGGMSCG